jgi:hypothetical protein
MISYKINYSESKGGSSTRCIKGDISLSNCPAISPCYSKDTSLCYNKDGTIPLNILNPGKNKLSQKELNNLASIGLQQNIIEKKLCNQGYKYCDQHIQIGNCILNEKKCNDDTIETDKKYQSDFARKLLYLEHNKATNDNFIYEKYVENEFIKKYKLPKDPLVESYYLVQIDINKLKQYMGISVHNAGAHNKIYTPTNIELLGWLLAGLHGQDINHINTSFIKYYFTNLESYIEVPIIATATGHKDFNIVDGRHRLGFYNYFNINGIVLTDAKGYDILVENNIKIDYIELEYTEIDYFNKNILKI